MHDLFVDRVPRRAERGEFAVRPVALQHITLRHRLTADLIGDCALDDRPVHPARAGLLLDILEAAVDHRIERIELALDPPRLAAVPWAATAPIPPPRPALAPWAVASGAIAAGAISTLTVVPRAAVLPIGALFAWPASAAGPSLARAIGCLIGGAGSGRARAAVASPWRTLARVGSGAGLGRCRDIGRRALCGSAELRWTAPAPAPRTRQQGLAVGPQARRRRSRHSSCCGCLSASLGSSGRQRTRAAPPAGRTMAQTQRVRAGGMVSGRLARRFAPGFGGGGGSFRRSPFVARSRRLSRTRTAGPASAAARPQPARRASLGAGLRRPAFGRSADARRLAGRGRRGAVSRIRRVGCAGIARRHDRPFQ